MTDLHLYVNESAVLDVLPQVQELPLAERVTAYTRAYLRGAGDDLRHARITYVEIVGVSPRISHQRLQRRAIWIELLDHLADVAVERGEAPPDNYRLASPSSAPSTA